MPKIARPRCKACLGSGKNSKGGECIPCAGSGFKQTVSNKANVPSDLIKKGKK